MQVCLSMTQMYLLFYMRKRKNKLKYDLIRTFFVPLRRQFRLMYLEKCQSGRMSRTRNAVYGQPYRGFESLFFRQRINTYGRNNLGE